MIKKIKTVSLLLAILLCLFFPAVAAATEGINIYMGEDTEGAGDIKVLIDDERLFLEVAPFIEDGRTMVPMRPIFDALGATVDWNGVTKTVTAKRGETVVELVIDQRIAWVNGNPETLDTPARIINDRTFVPLRFVSQSFNAVPEWDGDTRTIKISRPVRATKLTLSPAELSLPSGQTAAITVTALMDDRTEEGVEGSAVSWRSANTSVAAVEDGTVTAVGLGNTTITATYEGASANVTVKVDESLSGISITPPNLSMEIRDKSNLTLVARYTDREQQSISADQAKWSSSNNNVVTVSAGEITAVAVGTARITATYHNYTATTHVEVFRDLPVAFKDIYLEEAIRSKLNKPSGDLYRSDLARITELDAYNLLIRDLSGIQYCNNLRTLSLERNDIRDITPLANLKALDRLSLGYNPVSDLAPLAALKNLRWLSLNNNQLSNIAALEELTSLRWLSLAGNELSSIDALTAMQDLETLNLSANRISSLSPLSELKRLVTLHFWDNQVSDLSPLSSLSRLTTINAWSNNINSVTPLAGLTNLSWLAIGDNPLDLFEIDLRRIRERGVFVSTDSF